MFGIEGFILIGGASSRMGTDKAQLRLGDETFVERISNALTMVADKISLVGSMTKHNEWFLPVVPDVYPGCGALGGVHAALHWCRAPWAVVVACDLPFVTAELLLRLASLASTSENFAAVAPVQNDNRPQPLCALYAREFCLPQAEQLLRSGERRAHALLRAVPTRWVVFSELSHLKYSHLFFSNINTPAEYRDACVKVEDNNQ
ncbi:MAG: molybdenum cofactor guanylyltransferase [Pyrinomonadaceae bacterium]|nr:molybdenum cofactor guanylyltransferase [Pyrinomonadaceae bacterium]